jgi:hypothetical protein
MEKLVAMRESAEFGPQLDQLHMLDLQVPLKDTGYTSVTVNYPGFAENIGTVAILPTLISYNFAHKSTPYFRWRCSQLARIGEKVRSRLQELRASGQKQWNATSWEIEAGNWQKDSCFFGTAAPQVATDQIRNLKAPSKSQAKSSATVKVQAGSQRRPIGNGRTPASQSPAPLEGSDRRITDSPLLAAPQQESN